MSTGNSYPIGVYLPAAADAGNTYVQSAVTYTPAPATFVGNLITIPSTATQPSRVYLSSDLVSDYPWTALNMPGHSIAYFVSNPLSG